MHDSTGRLLLAEGLVTGFSCIPVASRDSEHGKHTETAERRNNAHERCMDYMCEGQGVILYQMALRLAGARRRAQGWQAIFIFSLFLPENKI